MPEAAPDFDLAVIGSGGGAFAAAIRATKLGKRVVMIERSTVGGTCVNTGCVPSKALLAAAEARHVALDATGRFPGINTSAAPVDMAALIDGKRSLVEGMRSDKYVDLAADYGWDLRHGTAVFAGTPDEPVLEITGSDGARDSLTAAHYLVATGSTPWAPPVPGLDEVDYLTSTTAMELNEVPESLIVFGGGYVALEQAQLFARLGSKVTLLVRSRLAFHLHPIGLGLLVARIGQPMGEAAVVGQQQQPFAVVVETAGRVHVRRQPEPGQRRPRRHAAVGELAKHPERLVEGDQHGRNTRVGAT